MLRSQGSQRGMLFSAASAAGGYNVAGSRPHEPGSHAPENLPEYHGVWNIRVTIAVWNAHCRMKDEGFGGRQLMQCPERAAVHSAVLQSQKLSQASATG